MSSGRTKKLISFYPCLIAVLVFLLCLAVWPLRLLGHTTYESPSLETGIFPNLNLSDGTILTGEFTPTHQRLSSLSFRFLTNGQAPRDGTVSLALCDPSGKELTSITLESGDVMNYRWIAFPLEAQLEPGKTYQWKMQAEDYEDVPLALYSGSPSTAPEEAGPFFYNGSPEEKYSPAVIYTYTDKIDKSHCLPYYTAFLLLGILACTACGRFDKKSEER